MACFYVYSEGGIDISPKELRNLAYGQTDDILKYPTIDGIKTAVWNKYKLELLRYNISYAQETELKLNEAEETAKQKSGMRVTSIAENIAGYNKSEERKSDNFLSEFSKNFGTLFHDSLHYRLINDSENELKSRQKLLELLKDSLSKYNLLSETDKNWITAHSFLKSIIDFIIWATNNEASFYSLFESAILEFINSDIFRGKNYKSEFAIVSDPKAKSSTVGRVDLFIYDNEGNVAVVDFKTSSLASSTKAKLYHYVQLECYKRMLQANGISWKSCKLLNVNFQFGEEFKFAGVTEAENDLTLLQRSNASAKISKLFPRSVKSIITSDAQQRMDRARTVSSSLYRSKFFHKLDLENYTLYIIDQCNNNKPFKYEKLNEYVSGVIDGNNIKIIFSDGSKQQTLPINLFVLEELQAILDKELEIVGEYIRAFASNDKSNLQLLLLRNQQENTRIATNLSKYLSSNWEVLRNDSLESKGIITLYNKLTNKVEYLILTKSKYLQRLPLFNKENDKVGDKIISDVVPVEVGKKYYGYDKLPLMTVANAKLMDAIIYISEFNDLIPEGAEVQDIKVVSYTDGSASFNLDFTGFLSSLKLLEGEANLKKSSIENIKAFLGVYTKASQIKFVDPAQRLEDLVITSVMDVDINFPDHFSSLSINLKISKLELIQEELKRKYPEEFTGTNHEVKSEVQRIYANCSLLISKLLNVLSDKIADITRKGFTFLDSLVAGIYLLARGEMNAYTSDGYLITGLANGLETSVSYKNPDETSRRIQLSIDSYFTQVRKLAIDEVDEVNLAARKYFNYIQQNALAGGRILDAIFGYHSPYYKALMEKDPKDPSKVSDAFRFINPYTNNTLATHEKEYLEVLLWTFNRKRISSLLLDEDYKRLSYKELKANKDAFDKYKRAVNSDITLLNIPLKPASGVRGLVLGADAVLKGDKKLSQLYEEELDRLKEFVNPLRLTSYQRQEKLNRENSLLAFNQYLEDSESRVQRLLKKHPTDFEWNFTELANDYTIAYILYVVQKKLLKTIDNLLFALRAIENMTGLDMSDKIEAILKRVKISVYNDTLVDKEYTDLMALLGLAKAFGSYTKIALRPILYFKEMTLGSLKNLSAIVAGFILNGEKITLPILMEAASYVYGKSLINEKVDKLTGKLDLGEYDLLGLINNEYAITDRDANAISAKLSADNYGLFNVGSRTLFYNTVRPDWFVRMTLFVSKMIADGTWEAHSKGADGRLVYDIKKDKRFLEFWKHKNESNYSTENFEKQKALYITMMKLFESEGFTNLNYGQNGVYDPLPMAYTTLERNSIKEQIGLLYGFYDHEEKSIFQNETWYNMFTQFLTYLPGDVQKWLLIGLDGSVGYYTQEVDPIEKDENGDPKKLYYEKDSLGNEIKTTNAKNAEGKPNRPVMSWKPAPMDGLLVSMLKTGHDLVVDRQHLKDNPLQWKLALLGLFNILFGSLFGTIMLLLMTEGTGDKRELNAQEYALYDLATKIGQDLDFHNSVVRPVLDFNMAGTEYVSQIYGDAVKALTNNNYLIYNVLYDNLSILKDTHLA